MKGGEVVANNSNIEWTEATWNPVAGCSVVSPGCTHCYAMRMAARLEAMGQVKYAGLTKKVNGMPVWTGKINLDNDSLTLPLSWKKPKRVFVNSMSDLFHPDVPFEFVDKVFAVMALTPHHTYQVLTKRPEVMADYLNHPPNKFRIHFAAQEFEKSHTETPWPLPNVWLGTSCERQKEAHERIMHLLSCPAVVRFMSAEPLLGPIDLMATWGMVDGTAVVAAHGLDWVIVGGESGPGARPMDVDWARSIVEQCKAAGLAVFVKQLGSVPVWDGCGLVANNPKCPTTKEYIGGREVRQLHPKDKKGGDPSEWPEDLRVREFPGVLPATAEASADQMPR